MDPGCNDTPDARLSGNEGPDEYHQLSQSQDDQTEPVAMETYENAAHSSRQNSQRDMEVIADGVGNESSQRSPDKAEGNSDVEAGASSDRREDTIASLQKSNSKKTTTTKTYRCNACNKSYTTRQSLQRHTQSAHENIKVTCEICGMSFTQEDHLKRHVRTKHNQREPGPSTSKRSHAVMLDKNNDETAKKKKARSSEDNLPHALKKESLNEAEDAGEEKNTSQGGDGEDTLIEDDPIEYHQDASHQIDPDIKKEVVQHWSEIRTRREVGRRIQDVYNICLLGGVSPERISSHLRAVFNSLRCRCKMNISYGLILRHNETGELRYFYPSQNNERFFPDPFVIFSRTDMETFIEKVRVGDVLSFGVKQRPDTKWAVAAVTNMALYVNKMPNFPIGGANFEELPPYINNNPAIIGLHKRRQTGEVYSDNQCFFRCLARHKSHKAKGLERKAKELYRQYAGTEENYSSFDGVTLEDLPLLEKEFGTNIMVYRLVKMSDRDEDEVSDSEDEDSSDEEHGARGDEVNPGNRVRSRKTRGGGNPNDENQQGPATFAELIYRSQGVYGKTMYLNLFENHFSYIKDFSQYSKAHCCPKCKRVFRKRGNLQRHERSTACNNSPQYKFPSGVYTTKQTIFEKLENEGVVVSQELRYFPYWATFDFESYFQSIPEGTGRSTSGKMQLKNTHIPMSFSVCSNVPEYEEPKCNITSGDTQTLVNDMVKYLREISMKSYSILRKNFEDVFSQIDETIAASIKTEHEGKPDDESIKKHPLTKLKQDLDAYLTELPVVGFNSSKYDINLVKRYLYSFLQEVEPIEYLIKSKSSSYKAIKTRCLMFLDITNYLAAGYSYSDFLKAYDSQEKKGFFPFQWMDSLKKLDSESLPPREEFYDNLKKTDLPPEDYDYCKSVWRENGMKSMRDFLRWYNNKDVVPFLEAIAKMAEFYKEKKIDLFKDGISVSGLTLKYLFQTVQGDHDFFSLVGEQNKDLYFMMKKNLVGGPSIVFHRYHKKGETKIRGDKYCQKVIGYDANALYLWCLMQEMPVGPFIRRRAEERFKPVPTPFFYGGEVEWLEWESHKNDIKIQHRGNGQQKRVGQLRVDGFCKDSNTVYEFNGCYTHGHECPLSREDFNEAYNKPMSELQAETEERSRYIKSLGYSMKEIWSCEWTAEKKKCNPKLEQFLRNRQLPLQEKKTLSQDKILQAIREDNIFGMVECDIHVPDNQKSSFAEMPPIFKRAEISKDDIGEHMRNYATRKGLLNKPQTSLIGSMSGKKMLLATPLLKWYLEKGLEVTKIYQVVQYRPSRCFKTFGDEVSNARREGDSDPSKTIKADTMKLIGNSAYGKTISNKENFKDVKVCTTESKASSLINDQRFRVTNNLGGDVYEVELSKRSVKVDLPTQVGYFVYQYAKLKMLQFYYDFLVRFIDQSDFQLCQMDTDSMYIAISGESLESVIRPDMKEAYETEKYYWFPRKNYEMYDKRTPGLFKVEWEGDGITALCSKTYKCFGPTDKTSSKGLNKRQNDLTKEMYYKVLSSQKVGTGTNVGFRMDGNEMVTYSQVKGALSYLYIKRKVADDGVTTTYLDI